MAALSASRKAAVLDGQSSRHPKCQRHRPMRSSCGLFAHWSSQRSQSQGWRPSPEL